MTKRSSTRIVSRKSRGQQQLKEAAGTWKGTENTLDIWKPRQV
jgi:hypothetical protein